MEIFISDVPQRETEKSLTTFFIDVLSGLHIEDWVCQKKAGNTWAKLIFLSPSDGTRFLSHHGQTQDLAGSSDSFVRSTGLILKGNTLDCRLSDGKYEIDKFALRSLEMDKKARAEQKPTLDKSDMPLSREDYRTIPGTSISCGLWDYVESKLVFKPYWTLTESSTMKFNKKSMVFKTQTGQRLDISYHGVDTVAWEGLPIPAITITLTESPRFYQYPDPTPATPPTESSGMMESLSREPAILPQDLGSTMESLSGELDILPTDLDSMMESLCGALDILPTDFGSMMESLFGDHNPSVRCGPERNRSPGLNRDHQKVAGSCFVYRLLLTEESRLNNRIKDLSQIRSMPPIIRRHISVCQPVESFDVEFGQLLKLLSPTATSIPFIIRFQLQKLAQNGYLPPSKVIALLPEVEQMYLRSDKRICVNAICKLFLQIPFAGPDTEPAIFGLQAIVNLLKRNEQLSERDRLYLEEPVKSENVAVIHKATVTPAGIYLYGPNRESNNRVLRKYPAYHDYFLRVQFSDEDGMLVQYNPEASNGPIHDRFRKILNDGIHIAGQHFAFLGFSHSSLRARSCWFMAPFTHNGSLLYDRQLIKGLGNFSHIRSPAKCAARIGQAFSDTRDAIALAPGVVQEMEDVERNGRVFSDGVGTISKEALVEIWDGLLTGKDKKPTVLQIRYQGAKGMLALDSRLSGKSVFLRPSMIKFRESSSTDLEICKAGYKPLPLYLNQQMIKILEDMGVEHHFFMNLQAMEVERLRMTTSSDRDAAKFLKAHSVGEKFDLPWFLQRLSHRGLSLQDDSFLTDVVEAAVLVELRAMKYKARIPVKDGFTLLGILDETGVLEEDEIFCIVDVNGEQRVITGTDGRKVIITRSPALHPGDVQLAYAVTVPESSPLMQLRNCICFSQKGSRDLPSKLSGGDLDGDTYQIIFDVNAQPKRVMGPADYIKEPPLDLGRLVEREDMTEFFVKFMETDQLGRICNAHKILADQSDEGTLDSRCVKLAEMASTAVDFSKTGIPVDMDEMPSYDRCRPHFMAPGPHVDILEDEPISFENSQSTTDDSFDEDNDEDFKPYKYRSSKNILGKLYSAIDEREIFRGVQQNRLEQSRHSHMASNSAISVLQDVWKYIDSRCLLIDWKDYLDRARGIRDEYEESLFTMMFEYGPHPHWPLSEIEVFIGNILGKNGAQSIRQRDLSISMKGRFEADLSFTVKCITKPASHLYAGEDREVNNRGVVEGTEQALALSMACLWVGLNEDAQLWECGKRGNVELRSFGYVAAAVCLKLAEPPGRS